MALLDDIIAKMGPNMFPEGGLDPATGGTPVFAAETIDQILARAYSMRASPPGLGYPNTATPSVTTPTPGTTTPATLRQQNLDTARDSVERYFKSLGLNPADYQTDIQSKLNDILAGIPETDTNPGSYFKNAAQSIYGDLTSERQQRLQRELDNFFTPGYGRSQLKSTLDDSLISGLEAEQRRDADAIIQNMVKRGVLTGTGAKAAGVDLDRQAAGIRGQLQGFGDTILEGGRSKLEEIGNLGKQAAGTVKLGQNFDPMSYISDSNQVYMDFVKSMGDQLRAKVPTNLFKTAGLAAIGGAAQGAGNTKYDPLAAAGVIDDDDEDKNTSSSTSIF